MSQPLAVYLVTGSRDWSGDPDEITGSMRDFAARHPGRDCIQCWVRWQRWAALCALPVVLASVGTPRATPDTDAP